MTHMERMLRRRVAELEAAMREAVRMLGNHDGAPTAICMVVKTALEETLNQG